MRLRSVLIKGMVSDPVVEGPIPNGIGSRSGRPFGTTLIPLPHGWIEQEFFISGTAHSAPLGGGTAASYKTRILVRRPANLKAFNGTALLEWNNVSTGMDHDATWQDFAPTVYKHKFAFVGVAAQELSVQGSPNSLKDWDPVRYGSLNHPGDAYSWDIYQQAAKAVADPKVLGTYLKRRLATGGSQSTQCLNHYINNWQGPVGLFDGFLPVFGGTEENRTLVPILQINSQAERETTAKTPPDSDKYRMWELPGPAHTTKNADEYRHALVVYAQSNGTVDTYEPAMATAWGYQYPPGTCVPSSLYFTAPIFGAALVRLDNWVRTGVAPRSQPRIERIEGASQYDENGNVLGGVRSPLLDVPIATYYTRGGLPPGVENVCGVPGDLSPTPGSTQVFDQAKILSLYPTKEAYLSAFDAAVRKMLVAGTVLPEGAAEYERRARLVEFWG